MLVFEEIPSQFAGSVNMYWVQGLCGLDHVFYIGPKVIYQSCFERDDHVNKDHPRTDPGSKNECTECLTKTCSGLLRNPFGLRKEIMV